MSNSSVRCSSCSKNKQQPSKGKRLLKKVKYPLVEFNSLPGYLKDNEYIRGHYRANWPLKQTILSIFSLHNETLNIWTHLVGFFFFLCLTIYAANEIPKVVDLHSIEHLPDVLRRADLHKMHAVLLTCLPSLPDMADFHKRCEQMKSSLPSLDMIQSLSGWRILELLSHCLPERFSTVKSVNHTTDVCSEIGMNDELTSAIKPLIRQPITRWPFFAYLGGAMFCLLASTTCHLLCCHSERLLYIMLRVDYAGIASLISTSFYPLAYYVFMCHQPLVCYLYIGSITIMAIGTVLFSLFPGFQKPELRALRAILFSGMGLLAILPILHKNFLYWGQPIVAQTTPFEILMGVSYALGALFYATRIPERWMPGKFDIAGHSHQLFHILVIAGAYSHYRGALLYLQWREMEGC